MELASVTVRCLPRDLPSVDQQYWIEHQAELVLILDRAMRRTRNSSEYFTPLDGAEVPEQYQAILSGWYDLAAELDYAGPVAWRVKGGFTLKKHAPALGPCHNGFKTVKTWQFEDKPTPDAIVFWIPRLVGLNKRRGQQLQLLNELFHKYSLPEVQGFGETNLIAGLVLTHFKLTGERFPLNSFWARTDTRYSTDDRLVLGDFDDGGLQCSGSWDGRVQVNGGIFPLQVVLGL